MMSLGDGISGSLQDDMAVTIVVIVIVIMFLEFFRYILFADMCFYGWDIQHGLVIAERSERGNLNMNQEETDLF